MIRRIVFTAAVLATTQACQERTLGVGQAAAVSLDSIAAPSIVVGDSLRDTLGVIRPLVGTAYDEKSNIIPGFVLKYRVLDAGITLDSITGFSRGDSIRGIPIRILVDAGGLQTPPVQLFVVPRPDTIAAVSGTDSLVYSLTDTSAVFSSRMTVLVSHYSTTTLDPVPAYVVSYQIIYPTDTTLVSLVDEAGQRSHVDTTGIDGTAGRLVRLHPLSLTTATDSVIVLASTRYHGTLVPGSAVRFVLRIKPKS